MVQHHCKMAQIDALIEKLEKELLLIQLKQSPLDNYAKGQTKALADVIKELKSICE